MPDKKWSQFPSATPDSADVVVGLHAGDNARFTLANIIASIRQGLESIFVPRNIVGEADGVASLDNTGKVPTSQLPSSTGPEPATATPLMDGTGAVGASTKYAREDHEHPADTNKQAKITASGILKGNGQGGVSAATPGTDYQAPLTAGTDYATPAQLADKANPAQLAYVETGTTASRNYSAGEYISLNGLLYTADTAIASGATFYTSGGNKNLTECVGGGFNSLFTKTPKYTHFEIVSASSVDHLIKVESNVIIITNNATHTTNGSSLYYGIVSATNATYSNLIEVQKDSYRPTTVTAGAGKITITTTQNYIHVVVIECPT